MLGTANQDPPFVGMMSNGTSGNINNIDFRRADRPKLQPYEKMRMVANMVAAEVYRRSQTLEYRDWVPLAAAVKEIRCACACPARRTSSGPSPCCGIRRRSTAQEQVYARRIAEHEGLPAADPAPAAGPPHRRRGHRRHSYEVFVETGLEIKKSGAFPRTFTISLANGSYGYLPTPEHHKLGGYETWRGTSLFEPDTSTRITRTVLDLLAGLAK